MATTGWFCAVLCLLAFSMAIGSQSAPDWTNLDVPLSPCPPRCPSCGGLARPGVVWFGETLDPADLKLAT